MSDEIPARPSTSWLTLQEAGVLAPGLTSTLLRHLITEGRGPVKRRLSDGELIFDELVLRRWIESTVSHDWVYGCFGDRGRAVPNDARVHAYQDADLERLRRRRYISEAQLMGMIDWLPQWRLRNMRHAGVGPRFLKPARKVVLYVEEEALWWARQVPNRARPDSHEWAYDPLTFRRVHPSTPSDEDLVAG